MEGKGENVCNILFFHSFVLQTAMLSFSIFPTKRFPSSFQPMIHSAEISSSILHSPCSEYIYSFLEYISLATLRLRYLQLNPIFHINNLAHLFLLSPSILCHLHSYSKTNLT